MKSDINKDQLIRLKEQFKKYKLIIFICLVVLIYGFIILRGNQLSHATPKQSALTSSSSVNIPHINPVTVTKINQLQDNSVNVQSLFNQARQNPFQE